MKLNRKVSRPGSGKKVAGDLRILLGVGVWSGVREERASSVQYLSGLVKFYRYIALRLPGLNLGLIIRATGARIEPHW